MIVFLKPCEKMKSHYIAVILMINNDDFLVKWRVLVTKLRHNCFTFYWKTCFSHENDRKYAEIVFFISRSSQKVALCKKKISSPKHPYNRVALEVQFNFSKLRYERLQTYHWVRKGILDFQNIPLGEAFIKPWQYFIPRKEIGT